MDIICGKEMNGALTVEKLLIIDGNSILSRAFYGIRPLTAPDGTPTNAVYGFLNILLKYLEEEPPDYVCVAFDVKAKTFRHKRYEQYKAQRKPTPEDLLAQIPVMKEVLTAMNFTCLEQEGYEADDIIGTVSRICEEEGVECSILTGDKDDLQLASELVKVKLVITRMGSTTTTVYGGQEVKEKFGVTPQEYIDVKGLMGDSSDNIPGVAGIGEKTAFSLIGQYHSIEKIYEDLEQLDVTPSVRKKLTEGRESAYLSKELATIDRAVPMEIRIENYRVRDFERGALANLFTRLNFKSFLQKFDLFGEASGAENARAERLQCSWQKADETSVLEKLSGAADIYYLFDGRYLALARSTEEIWIVTEPDAKLLRTVFSDPAISKTGFDCKEDIVSLHKKGIAFEGLGFDVMIAAYLSEPTRSAYSIHDLTFERLGLVLEQENISEEADGQLAMDFDGGDKDEAGQAAQKLCALIKLAEVYRKELADNGQEKLYFEVELPLVEVLAQMQIVGVYIDKQALQEFGIMLGEQIQRLEEQIYREAGEKFNINSPKQLGHILFEVLELPHGKKTKTGYSTNVDVLNKLLGVHSIIEYIMDYRHMTKLQSTYVDGLLAVIDPTTGRIHSNFNQTVTATGRISSTEPNLQNIPVRLALGRELRRMFVAEREEEELVDADYSQIELRVLSHIADDKNMQDAFVQGVDIHTQTAAQVFGTELSEVTSIMRTRAKAVNFGIVYGIGAFSLAQDLKISRKEAQQYIDDYLKNYPGVKAYMHNVVENARRDGYVSSILGRRRYMPELKASNKITQAFGERVAMNAPIQGSAADIIKIAMVRVYRRLKQEGLQAKLILQVHDELIVESPKTETAQVEKILKEEMENAVSLRVPLIADMKSGKSWYDTK